MRAAFHNFHWLLKQYNASIKRETFSYHSSISKWFCFQLGFNYFSWFQVEKHHLSAEKISLSHISQLGE